MDPRLHSIHLEAQPRREAFRQARAQLQNAAGSHTLAGDLRPNLKPQDLEGMTCAKGQEPVAGKHQEAVCWLVDRGKALPLHIGLNSVGRLPDNDVVIEDACVSRRHCAVLVHSDLTCELHDVASKNGTTINGHKLQGPMRLEEGDEICLCDRRLKFTKSLLAGTQAPLSRRKVDSDHTLAG
jgi:hypothetical protein